jgi:hypothetical protein
VKLKAIDSKQAQGKLLQLRKDLERSNTVIDI